MWPVLTPATPYDDTERQAPMQPSHAQRVARSMPVPPGVPHGALASGTSVPFFSSAASARRTFRTCAASRNGGAAVRS